MKILYLIAALIGFALVVVLILGLASIAVPMYLMYQSFSFMRWCIRRKDKNEKLKTKIEKNEKSVETKFGIPVVKFGLPVELHNESKVG